MSKIFEVTLKDDEALGVYFGNEILGVILRPNIEKVIKLISSLDKGVSETHDGYKLINKHIYQDSDLRIGCEKDGFRCLEKSLVIEYVYDLENHRQNLGTMLYETFDLKIVKFLV